MWTLACFEHGPSLKGWNSSDEKEASLGDHPGIREWEQDGPGAGQPFVAPLFNVRKVCVIVLPNGRLSSFVSIFVFREFAPPARIRVDEEQTTIPVVVAFAGEEESNLPV